MERRAERELEEERASRKADLERLRGIVSGDEETQPRREDKGDSLNAGPTPAEVLLRRVEEDVEAIRRVASSSKNLKGNCVKALKEASTSILEAAEHMNSRTSSREIRILQRDNDRLRMELQFIKQELRDIHKDIALQKEAREMQPPIVSDSKPLTRAEERPARARREPPHR